MRGNRRLGCEMTFLAGKLAYDLNGRTREAWEKLPKDYGRQGNSRWDGIVGGQR
jgi:hypothetical protein